MEAPPDIDSVTITAVLPTGVRKPFNFVSTDSVSCLIDSINADDTLGKPADATTIIIYGGRILEPQESFSSLGLLTEFSVLVFFRLAGERSERNEELHGFDRLARMNYNEEQIAAIRAEFHSVRGTEGQSTELQIAAEDEWLPVLFNGDGPRMTVRQRRGAMATESSLLTLICLSLGSFFSALFFGPISFFILFFSFQNTASTMGLLLGIIGYYFCSTYSEITTSVRFS
jgi:hypothetical protein